jgi:hypothetical protein
MYSEYHVSVSIYEDGIEYALWLDSTWDHETEFVRQTWQEFLEQGPPDALKPPEPGSPVDGAWRIPEELAKEMRSVIETELARRS